MGTAVEVDGGDANVVASDAAVLFGARGVVGDLLEVDPDGTFEDVGELLCEDGPLVLLLVGCEAPEMDVVSRLEIILALGGFEESLDGSAWCVAVYGGRGATEARVEAEVDGVLGSFGGGVRFGVRGGVGGIGGIESWLRRRRRGPRVITGGDWDGC